MNNGNTCNNKMGWIWISLEGGILRRLIKVSWQIFLCKSGHFSYRQGEKNFIDGVFDSIFHTIAILALLPGFDATSIFPRPVLQEIAPRKLLGGNIYYSLSLYSFFPALNSYIRIT